MGMTTFSGQSCVLGTAESCGLRLEECGALGFVLTLIGQEMGSMLAAAVFWLGVSQRWRRSGSVRLVIAECCCAVCPQPLRLVGCRQPAC